MRKKVHRRYALLMCAVLIISCVIPVNAKNPGDLVSFAANVSESGNEDGGEANGDDVSAMSGQNEETGESEMNGESGETGKSEMNGESGETGKSEMNGESGETGKSEMNGESGETGESEMNGESGETDESEMNGESGETGESGSQNVSDELQDGAITAAGEPQAGESILDAQVRAANERMMITTFSNAPVPVIGTPEWPFSLASVEALQDMEYKIGHNVSYEVGGQSYEYSKAAYQLDADIVFEGQKLSLISGMESGFVLDGQNHTISGFSGSEALFVVLDSGCIIKNLILEGTMAAMQYDAMLCSTNRGTIENCTVSGTILGSNDCAGITYENYGTITNCTSQVSIEGFGRLAGIAAFLYEGEIAGCTNAGTIRSTGESANTYRDPVGGIVAEGLDGVRIENCSNTGAVINNDSDYAHAGGIAGYGSFINIVNCVNSGSVESIASPAGGIVGYGVNTSISACSNAGSISSLGKQSGAGGIVGESEGGSIGLCYNTGGVRGTGEGGLAGGIAGRVRNQTVILSCWNSGVLTARDAGGIAGQTGYGNDSCVIRDCYNIGEVNGDAFVGGITGSLLSTASIENCYNTGNITIRGTSFNTDVGGICGNGTGSHISSCYALNESIHNEHSTSGERIRRWDHNNLENNYAWDQMLVNGQVVTDGKADNADGADVTSDQLADPENSAKLWETFSEDIWVKVNGQLPILKNAGAQNSQLPQHIINNTSQAQGVIDIEGKGTEEEPYKITTEEEWKYIVSKMNSYSAPDQADWLKANYVLENDLDLSKIILVSAAPSFKGQLDGQGHKISGIVWKGDNYSNPRFSGLFASVASEGVIKNLFLEGSLTMESGQNNLGLLAGDNAGTLLNCYAVGTIRMEMDFGSFGVGGIAGQNSGRINGCSAAVDIVVTGNATASAGGIAGRNKATISNCRSTGNVSCAGGNAGGISGIQSVESASTYWCYSTASVSGNYAGGITGSNAGVVGSSVALSETITGSQSGNQGRIAGKVSGKGRFENNRAWNMIKDSRGMLLNASLAGMTNNKNGDGLPKEQFSNKVIWEVSGFNLTNWRMQEGMLPVLVLEGEGEPLPEWLLTQEEEPILEGLGTPEAPYEIHDLDDLLYVMDKVLSDDAYAGASYKLTGDIDLTDVVWKSMGSEERPFKGTFDGQNHRISHLKLQENAKYRGFFGVTEGANIHHLTVQGSVTGGDFSGGLVGYAKEGTVIEACQSQIDVWAYTQGGGTGGGIAGINEGTISHCVSYAEVRGQDAAGGIAGKNTGVIEHSYSIGSLISANVGAGGIAAQNEGTIRFCAAMLESAEIAQGTGVVGKITVSNTGTLENNYSWSAMEIKGNLAEDTGNMGLNGKGSAITLITGNALLFPEDYWSLAPGYYPTLIGQTATNYLLIHQVDDGQELLNAVTMTLEKPQAQAVPVTTLSGDGWSAAVSWKPQVENVYDYDTAYTAEITVTAAQGYVFDEATAATLNGEAVEAERKDSTTLVLRYTFEKTVKAVQTVEMTLPEPKAQAVPVTTLSGDGWSAAISWTPQVENAYDYDTAYTAEIIVTAAQGYVFDEATAATLNGEAVEAERKDSTTLVLKYTFEKTVKAVQTVEMTLPEPKAQAAPVTTLSGDGWSANIVWKPQVLDVFDYGTEYTAVITITPGEGYAFTENTEFLLNGAGVEPTEEGGLVSVAVRFEKTEEKVPETPESEETESTEETEETEQTEETSDSESDESKETSGQPESKDPNVSGNDKTDAQKTGDSTAVPLLMVVLLVSGVGICVILGRMEKKRQDKI